MRELERRPAFPFRVTKARLHLYARIGCCISREVCLSRSSRGDARCTLYRYRSRDRARRSNSCRATLSRIKSSADPRVIAAFPRRRCRRRDDLVARGAVRSRKRQPRVAATASPRTSGKSLVMSRALIARTNWSREKRFCVANSSDSFSFLFRFNRLTGANNVIAVDFEYGRVARVLFLFLSLSDQSIHIEPETSENF